MAAKTYKAKSRLEIGVADPNTGFQTDRHVFEAGEKVPNDVLSKLSKEQLAQLSSELEDSSKSDEEDTGE